MAHDGKRLMKWSATATGRELRKVAGLLDQAYTSFAEDVRNAFMLLARCRYFYPNMGKMVLEMQTPTPACITIGMTIKSVAGCRVGMYIVQENCPDSFPCLGIDKGGESIYEAKTAWRNLVVKMITIGGLRNNFKALDESHKAANKKSNVLGKVIIPRTTLTIRYILSELEELAREEFFRLKKVLEVKYRHKKKKKGEDKDVIPEKEEKQVRLAPPPPPEPCTPTPTPSVEVETPKAVIPTVVSTSFVTPEDVEPKDVKPPVLTPPLPPIPPPPPRIKCIVCGGPMHPKEKRPLTEEEIKQENAVRKELKETLSRVLNATEEYEKKVDKIESLKEFKKNASDLKERLQLLPLVKVIPDNVDVAKLCDICKELYNAQFCKVCGESLTKKDDESLTVAKESKRKLQQQLDTVLNLIKEYESQGKADDEILDFKQTASRLKIKLDGPPIPSDIDVSKLCHSCKNRYYQLKTHKSEPSVEVPKKGKQSSTATSSVQQTPTGSNITLGVFETEEITEVIQVFNPDGTVSEKRRQVTIKRKLEDGSNQYDSQEQNGPQYRDSKNVGRVAVIYSKRGLEEKPVVIDKTITQLPIRNRMVRDCVSSNFDFGFEEVIERATPKDANSLNSCASFTDTDRTTNSSGHSHMSFKDAKSSQEVKYSSDDSTANLKDANDAKRTQVKKNGDDCTADSDSTIDPKCITW